MTIFVVFTTKEKQFLFSNYYIRNAVEEQTYLFLMIDGRDWRLLEELALQMVWIVAPKRQDLSPILKNRVKIREWVIAYRQIHYTKETAKPMYGGLI